MAIVVPLKRDQAPSTNAFSVLVDQDSDKGATGITDIVLHRFGAIFYVAMPYGQAQQARALAEARKWADGMGLTTVYLSHQVQTAGRL